MPSHPVSVVFALIGRPVTFAPPYERLNSDPGARRFVGIASSPDLDVPYAALNKVEVEVDLDEPVVNVLRKTATAFDEPGDRVVGLRLFEPALATGFPPDEPAWSWERVPFVDAEFRLWWRDHSCLDLPYGWLIRAADLNLIAGDPYRPYFMAAGRGGIRHGLGPVTWEDVHALWGALEPWLEGVSAVGGTAVVVAWLSRAVRRLAAGLSIMGGHAAAWSDRGASPTDLLHLLATVEQLNDLQHERLLSQVLGCSLAEARVLARLGRGGATHGTEEQMADALATALAQVLLEYYRDPDPDRWVARALSSAPDDLADLIPPCVPQAPDAFTWDWPSRT